VQVYGVPDEKYGEQVAAAIIKKPDSDLSEEVVKEFCRESIAHFKVPFYVDFVDEYPMTASGKIQKYRLREAAIERYGLQEAAEVETA
jgi:fatty-acyl-CoA synthase